MVSEEFNLRGKTALVAGDSRFWGKYVAAALAEAGADVAVAAKNSKKLDEAVRQVLGLGRKAMAVPIDMTKSSRIEKMVEQVLAEFGKIDILVNASDPEFVKPFVEINEDEWHRIVETSLLSVFHCCQAVGKHMLERRKGRLINITSCLAERGLTNSSAYCVAMGGILQLTRALALEWARDGITVNAIGPAWFSETGKTGMGQEDVLLRYLPSKRYGHPGEIGSLLVYLASDASDFITGQLVYVDGAVMVHI
jgi:NAD(P)-dependent dehydrogenase (short-subunit alcohol dehydrogenase family)